MTKETVEVFMGDHHLCVGCRGQIIYVCKVFNRVRQTMRAYLKHHNYQPSWKSIQDFPWLKKEI